MPGLKLGKAERIGPMPKLQSLLGDQSLDDFLSQMIPAGSIIPAQFRKKLAAEFAEKSFNLLKEQGLDKIADVVGDILGSKKHSGITAHLSEVSGMGDPTASGRYFRGQLDRMKKILAREPIRSKIDLQHAPPDFNKMMANLSDEELAKMAQRWGGNIHLNTNLEEAAPAEIYKVMRHEMSHAADDIAGKRVGKTYQGHDPKYWVNLQEVRARASEPNYIRDMSGKAEPRQIIDLTSEEMDQYFRNRDEFKPFTSELPHRRSRYSEKVATELKRGYDIGRTKLAEQYGRISPTTQELDYMFDRTPPPYNQDFNREIEQTASHYFAPTIREIMQYHPKRIAEEFIPGLLDPPEAMVPFKKYITPKVIPLKKK